jgi:hypothetical protein
MKKLKCQDFHFYPNGIFRTTKQKDSYTNSYFADVEAVAQSIRIFGTEKQIDDALNEYCERTNLALDECYSFEVEKKGSYWYDIYKDPEARNLHVKKRLEIYKELYLKKSSEALIINI